MTTIIVMNFVLSLHVKVTELGAQTMAKRLSHWEKSLRNDEKDRERARAVATREQERERAQRARSEERASVAAERERERAKKNRDIQREREVEATFQRRERDRIRREKEDERRQKEHSAELKRRAHEKEVENKIGTDRSTVERWQERIGALQRLHAVDWDPAEWRKEVTHRGTRRHFKQSRFVPDTPQLPPSPTKQTFVERQMTALPYCWRPFFATVFVEGSPPKSYLFGVVGILLVPAILLTVIVFVSYIWLDITATADGVVWMFLALGVITFLALSAVAFGIGYELHSRAQRKAFYQANRRKLAEHHALNQKAYDKHMSMEAEKKRRVDTSQEDCGRFVR